VPHVKRDVAAQQVNRPPQQRPPQQPVTSTTQQPEIDDVQKFLANAWGPVLTHAMGVDIPPAKRPKIDFTPEQEKRGEVAVNAIKNDVMQMLADNASYQQIDDCTIVINTRLSQQESDEIDKRLYRELGDIIGNENVEKLDSILINGLRQATYAWGRGERQYTVIGVDKYARDTDKQTEQPLKTAEAFVVKSLNNLAGGLNFGETYRCTSKDSFIKEYGALAVATLQMATREGN